MQNRSRRGAIWLGVVVRAAELLQRGHYLTPLRRGGPRLMGRRCWAKCWLLQGRRQHQAAAGPAGRQPSERSAAAAAAGAAGRGRRRGRWRRRGPARHGEWMDGESLSGLEVSLHAIAYSLTIALLLRHPPHAPTCAPHLAREGGGARERLEARGSTQQWVLAAAAGAHQLSLKRAAARPQQLQVARGDADVGRGLCCRQPTAGRRQEGGGGGAEQGGAAWCRVEGFVQVGRRVS